MKRHSSPSLQFLGAAGTVTGSRYLLEADGRRVLIDCGLFQGYKQLRDRNRAAFPVPPETIDTVLLTHAHFDHSGYIPALVRNGFRGEVICTPATAELCSLLLPDSGHLQEEEARYAKRKGYSAPALRAKVFGQRLGSADFLALMRDTVSNRLSDIELTAFVTACAGDRLDKEETVALTKAMLAVGERIDWGSGAVLDKHCGGGLPGNRTTPIVFAIVAAAGHRIPKTSSRAITSPAGTADAMEVMAPVALDLDTMRRVVEREGGCIVWGGNVRLSPADDVLIRIERPLDFDSDGQLVASVLSNKAAAGSTHVLIDIPIGPTAKVRSSAAAAFLEARLLATAQALGLNLSMLRTDGLQPVGYGIGPALEAEDVLNVLRKDAAAPCDLRSRALDLAGALLDAAPGAAPGSGRAIACMLLDSGAALRKFLAVCEAQGGFAEPGVAPHTRPVLANRTGQIQAIDNRQLAKVAKVAGAPRGATAGVVSRVRIGDGIHAGEPLFHVHSQSPGELEYAFEYASVHPDIFEVAVTQ